MLQDNGIFVYQLVPRRTVDDTRDFTHVYCHWLSHSISSYTLYYYYIYLFLWQNKQTRSHYIHCIDAIIDYKPWQLIYN